MKSENMEKYFNTAGLCNPDKHYMVNIDDRLNQMEALIDKGAYFTINRARQFGKTTTLRLLKKKLAGQYLVFSISFEGIGKNAYASETAFCQSFCRLLYRTDIGKSPEEIPPSVVQELKDMCHADIDLIDLSDFISSLCRQTRYPVVLMIDEADQAGGQEVFLSFLGMLRDKYLNSDEQPAFRSVILAGIYDIKNLKLKIRPDTEHQYNSPWNISSDFTADMSFSVSDIAGMLREYEKDHCYQINIPELSQMLYDYTSGYPFLVSRLCKLMDEIIPCKDEFAEPASAWNKEGLLAAVSELLGESNTLFDDMIKKLNDFPELKKMLEAILFNGEKFPYNPYNYALDIGSMFGFIRNNCGTVSIANRIFETQLYNLFLSEEIMNSRIYRAAVLDENQFIQNGDLNMERILEKFTETFSDIYADADQSFIEENGRRFFLLYLKPIINGTGNYYIEARTRDMRRTDVIVDYCGKQYVCELKIWHGEEYNRRGEKQLIGYLNDYHLSTGYMLSFNFNKKKKTGIKKLVIEGKTLIEAVV